MVEMKHHLHPGAASARHTRLTSATAPDAHSCTLEVKVCNSFPARLLDEPLASGKEMDYGVKSSPGKILAVCLEKSSS